MSHISRSKCHRFCALYRKYVADWCIQDTHYTTFHKSTIHTKGNKVSGKQVYFIYFWKMQAVCLLMSLTIWKHDVACLSYSADLLFPLPWTLRQVLWVIDSGQAVHVRSLRCWNNECSFVVLLWSMNHGINFTEHFVKKPVVTGHVKRTVCRILDKF